MIDINMKINVLRWENCNQTFYNFPCSRVYIDSNNRICNLGYIKHWIIINGSVIIHYYYTAVIGCVNSNVTDECLISS